MAVKWKWNNNTGGGNVPAGLENRVQTLETDNTTNKQNITNLQNDTVKLSGAQNISGVKTITATVEALKFNSGTDSSAYISGYKSGNQRVWYVGKSSSTDNHLRIGADRGNIKLEPSGVVDLNNKKISFLADPATNQDAANKLYVDNKIRKRVIDMTNRQNNTYTIEPAAGYEILSVMVGRKRTSDGFYFFQSHINLNFQVFLHTDGKYKVYTQGPVNDFGADFRIIVVEMKV